MAKNYNQAISRLDLSIKISSLVALIIWTIIGILLIVSGLSLMEQQKKAQQASTASVSQPVPASQLSAAQKDCVIKTWGNEKYNKYSQDLTKAPLGDRQKLTPCFK